VSPSPVDESKLDFDIISDISELSIINTEEKDEKDTLGVRKFLKYHAHVYAGNNLTSIWKVMYNGDIIGFFTISMNGMEASIIPQSKKVNEMRGRYPAILLGQMWVRPDFRGRKVAYWICQYVVGLARRTSPKIACSCVVLQTDESKIQTYENAKFVRSVTSPSGLIWMYRSST
jgi:GNAT superfamily N-acetyltransferase